MKYWEMIADKLSKAGYSVGWNRIVTQDGMWLWQADAAKDGKRFIGRAEELAVAFAEVEAMAREHG
jgi:hypothetical protein